MTIFRCECNRCGAHIFFTREPSRYDLRDKYADGCNDDVHYWWPPTEIEVIEIDAEEEGVATP